MLREQRINIPMPGLDEQSGDRNVYLTSTNNIKRLDAMRQSDADSAYEDLWNIYAM